MRTLYACRLSMDKSEADATWLKTTGWWDGVSRRRTRQGSGIDWGSTVDVATDAGPGMPGTELRVRQDDATSLREIIGRMPDEHDEKLIWETKAAVFCDPGRSRFRSSWL